MIEKRKIIVQQGQQNNNCNPSMANTFIVQGDPTKMYVRHLTRKRNHIREIDMDKTLMNKLGFIVLRPYAQSLLHSFHFSL